MWHIHDNGDWFLMVVAMVLFWAPLLLIAFWAFGRATSPSSRPPDRTDDDPREIARRSYAAATSRGSDFTKSLKTSIGPIEVEQSDGTRTQRARARYN